MPSRNTTNLGPRVSFTTLPSDRGPVHVYGDSNATLEWAGLTKFSNLSSSNETVASLSIGHAATRLTSALYSTWTLDFPSLAANVTSLNSVAITGIVAGDVPLVTMGSTKSANFQVSAYVESNNSLTYDIGNVGAATQDISVVTFRAIVFRATT